MFPRAIQQRSTIIVLALAMTASVGSARLAAGLNNPVSADAESPSEEPTNAEALDTRVKELLAWAADKTGYSADCVKVTALFVAPSTINLLAFGSDLNQATVESLAVGSTIFLPIWFTIGENDDILVHELTHVLQYENNARFACVADQEREAYITAAAFSDETGIGVKPSRLFMSQLRCNPY